MKRLFLILLALCMSLMHFAATKIGDLYYLLDSGSMTAEVTSGPSSWKTSLTTADILESITDNNKTYTVTRISTNAFNGCSNLTSVTIPNSVKRIEQYAFYNCTNLTSVTIGNGVKEIEYRAFDGCYNVTSVFINDVAGWCEAHVVSTPLKSGVNLYLNEELITNLVIPDNVASISDYAFYGCINLTSVSIGNGVTKIGDKVFSGCNSLTSITIPSCVTSIGKEAFDGCHINEIHYGGTLQEWYDKIWTNDQISPSTRFSLYIGNELLTNWIIPDSITSIKDKAFYNCKSLTSVTIGNSVTKIGEDAFYLCEGLTSVHIKDLAAWCSIYFVSVWSNPLFCARNIYLNNELITDLEIPNSITSIGQYAFNNCWYLTSITIPNSVKEIGRQAFHNCKNLTYIVSNAIQPPYLGKEVFELVNKHIPLYVPSESIFAYQAAAQWGDFINILPIGSNEGIEEIVKKNKKDGKLIYAGKLYIQRGDKLYTLQGQEVK